METTLSSPFARLVPSALDPPARAASKCHHPSSSNCRLACGFLSFSLHFPAHFRLTFSLNIEELLRSLPWSPGQPFNWIYARTWIVEAFTAFLARYLGNFAKDSVSGFSAAFLLVFSPTLCPHTCVCVCASVCGTAENFVLHYNFLAGMNLPRRSCGIKIIIRGNFQQLGVETEAETKHISLPWRHNLSQVGVVEAHMLQRCAGAKELQLATCHLPLKPKLGTGYSC